MIIKKTPLVFNGSNKYSYSTCNFYVGCSNGCSYCCCNKILGKIWVSDPILVFRDENDAINKFKKSIDTNLEELKKFGIFFSLTCDPLLPTTKELTYKAVNYCLLNSIPVKILTKCTEWEKDSFLTNIPLDKKNLIHIGFSLSGRDDFELGASTNKERIDLLTKLYDLGFKTWISAEPIINISSTIKTLELAKEKCYMIRFELLSVQKYPSDELSYNYKKEDLVELYDWVCKNIQDVSVFWGDRFISQIGISRKKLSSNCTKTGDLILEYK